MTADTRAATRRLIKVLRQLDDMAEANIDRSQQIKARVHHLLTRLEAGEDLADIVEAEAPPRIPTLITANIEALHHVGATLRKAEAAALRAHGYTMEQIAELFGVTRQRISVLLRHETRRRVG
jgi:transcriptional regulator